MTNNAPRTLLPTRVRRWVMGGVITLALIAAGLIAWRGPAILLDLAAAAWAACF